MSSHEPTPGDSDPEVNPAGDGVNITEADASQGRSGLATFTVLIISTVLVVIVLFAIYAANAHHKGAPNPNGGGQEGVGKSGDQSAVFNTAEPSPKQNPGS